MRARLLSPLLLLPVLAAPSLAPCLGEDSFPAEVSTTPPSRKPRGIDPPLQHAPLRDPDEEWVEETLESLTLDEKIGQMIMPQWTSNTTGASHISTYHVGGFIFLAQSSTTILSATNGLQAHAQTQGELPLLFSIDCEAGAGARVTDGTRFPMNMGLASTRRTDLARQQGLITAAECRALGVHIGFGPVLDVATEPTNPIIGIRSYGDDTTMIEELAAAYVDGATSGGLLSTFKHYPGHGGTTSDSHQTLPIMNITCDELMNVHVKPYRTLIQQGRGDIVMSAHVWYPCLDPGNNAVPATLSKAAMTDVLRTELGFQGVVMSDAFNMAGLQIVSSTREAAKVAVANGLDIILMPVSVADAVNGIKDGLQSGEITQAQIDNSVRRILRLKSRVGFPEENPIVDTGVAANTVGHADHWAVAEAIGQLALSPSITEQGFLPLTPDMDVLVLTLSLASNNVFYTYPVSHFTDELRDHLPAYTLQSVSTTVSSGERATLVSQALQADRVIVVGRSWRPTNPAAQRQLIQQLIDADVRLLYLTFGNPFQFLETPDLENFLVGYSTHYSTQEQGARMLVGQADVDAPWPVVLPLPVPMVLHGLMVF